MLALALLLGGAVGNFIDRLLFGFVTDMFATTFVNFAVFNVADVGVVLGGVLLCLHLIVFFRPGGKEGTGQGGDPMNVTLSVETAGQRADQFLAARLDRLTRPRPKNSWRRAMSSARAGP